MVKNRFSAAIYVSIVFAIAILCLSALFLFVWSKTSAVSAEINAEQQIIDNRNFEDGSIIVVLNSESSRYKGISDDIIEKLSSVGIESIEDLSELPDRYVNSDGSLDDSIPSTMALHYDDNPFRQILYVKLKEKTKKSVLNAIEKVEQYTEVEYVEPNWIQDVGNFAPNDQYYSEQWALNTSDGINIEAAWNMSLGTNTVRVGVIDSGIATHEDLNANVQIGYDFYNKNSITDDPLGGHGTHVAGIIGAIGNNALGISGVTPNVSLVPLQTAYDTSGLGNHNTSELLEAIKYATGLWDNINQRISILNYSIGGFGTNIAIAAAAGNFPGLFVWSAGNNAENTDAKMYINNFNLSNLISVGAIDPDGNRRNSSNYGMKSVDIYAPGGNILSTFPADICEAGNCEKNNGGKHIANGYHIMSGTSMAAPHVAGVAALLLSIYPDMTGSQLKAVITENADTISISTPSGNQNVKKLNAYSAVSAMNNKTFTVTFDKNIGNGGTSSFQVKYGEALPSITCPTNYGYDFAGYRDSQGKYYYDEAAYPTTYYDKISDTTLTAVWDPKSWQIYYHVLTDNSNTDMNDIIDMTYDVVNPKYGTAITAPDVSGWKFKEWRKYNYYFELKNEESFLTTNKTVTIHNVVAPNEVSYFLTACYEKVEDSSCVAEGTLITLADGSQKAVENLSVGDMALVWNLYTGKFDYAPILFIDSHGERKYTVTTLYFSDGTKVEMIDEHGFWDCDLNRYVMLHDHDSAQYIGHWFYKQIVNDAGEFVAEKVQLINVWNENRVTVAYSPVTYSHLCYYVNGMLSVPGAMGGLVNIFEVDASTMKFDSEAFARDVETYGLFTYEDFDGLITEQLFEAVNAQYLKVAIGKGMITWDEILLLIDRYGACI